MCHFFIVQADTSDLKDTKHLWCNWLMLYKKFSIHVSALLHLEGSHHEHNKLHCIWGVRCNFLSMDSESIRIIRWIAIHISLGTIRNQTTTYGTVGTVGPQIGLINTRSIRTCLQDTFRLSRCYLLHYHCYLSLDSIADLEHDLDHQTRRQRRYGCEDLSTMVSSSRYLL